MGIQTEIVSWHEYLEGEKPEYAQRLKDYYKIAKTIQVYPPELCIRVTDSGDNLQQQLLFYEVITKSARSLEILGTENGTLSPLNCSQLFYEEAIVAAMQRYCSYRKNHSRLNPVLEPFNVYWLKQSYKSKRCFYVDSPTANLTGLTNFDAYLASLSKEHRYKVRKSRNLGYRVEFETQFPREQLNMAIHWCREHWEDKEECRNAILQQIWAYTEICNGRPYVVVNAYKNDEFIGFSTNLINGNSITLETVATNRSPYIGNYLLAELIKARFDGYLPLQEICEYDPGVAISMSVVLAEKNYHLYKTAVCNATKKYRLYWVGVDTPVDEVTPPYCLNGQWVTNDSN